MDLTDLNGFDGFGGFEGVSDLTKRFSFKMFGSSS